MDGCGWVWLPSGKQVGFTAEGAHSVIKSADGMGEAKTLTPGIRSAISPDGRHLASVSDESGRLEVYVTRFPSGEGKWQVSANGGGWQRWGRAGDRIFYEENNTLMEVQVATEPSFSLGSRRVLFSANPIGVTLDRGYAVGPEDSRFLVVQELVRKGTAPGITIVQNWFAEFKDQP